MNFVIVIFALFTALGVAYDKLAYNKHKTHMHAIMVNGWYKIGMSKIPDFKGLICKRFLKSVSFLTKYKIFSWKYFLVTIIISWVFTSITAIIGSYIEDKTIDIPYILTYISNYPFDLITIIVTVKIVKAISKMKSGLRIFLLILFEIVITYFLSAVCLISNYKLSSYFDNIISRYDVPKPFGHTLERDDTLNSNLMPKYVADGFSKNPDILVFYEDNTPFYSELKGSIIDLTYAMALKKSPRTPLIFSSFANVKEGDKEHVYPLVSGYSSHIYIVYTFAALSTFIPVVFLFGLIFILIISKAIIEIGKLITTFLLDRFTESGIDKEKKTFNPEKFSPGTLTGILLGTISAILGLIKEFLH